MFHHVALEVRSDQVAGDSRFWELAGFARVMVPEALGPGFTWFESGGAQIHLVHTDDPMVPANGHVAVAAPDFEQTVARLEDEGFEVREGRKLWGARRAKVTCPSGHQVELIEGPPPGSDDPDRRR